MHDIIIRDNNGIIRRGNQIILKKGMAKSHGDRTYKWSLRFNHTYDYEYTFKDGWSLQDVINTCFGVIKSQNISLDTSRYGYSCRVESIQYVWIYYV